MQRCLAFLAADHHLSRPVNCQAGARRGPCACSIRYTQTFRDVLPWFVPSTVCGLRPEDIHAKKGWVRVEAQTFWKTAAAFNLAKPRVYTGATTP